jgi:hypothetical protein
MIIQFPKHNITRPFSMVAVGDVFEVDGVHNTFYLRIHEKESRDGIPMNAVNLSLNKTSNLNNEAVCRVLKARVIIGDDE